MNQQLDQDVVASFISEAKGYLPEIMLGLEAFAAAPEQRGSLQAAFRFAHFIKEAASLLGFHEASKLAYQLEVRLEMLIRQEVLLTPEMLNDLCQNVQDISDVLDTSLSELPLFAQFASAETEPPLTDTTTTTDTTGFDFFFAPPPAAPQVEERTESAALNGDALAQTPSAWADPRSENETAPPTSWQDSNFSVSLPAAADTPTLGELNLGQVAAELKESLSHAPLPPQPEFPLPNDLMPSWPDFRTAVASQANAEVDLLEVPENIASDLAYDDLTDNLADALLSTTSTSSYASESLSALSQEECRPEARPEVLELLPLPELPELLQRAATELTATTAPCLDDLEERPAANKEEFLAAEPMSETPTSPLNNDARPFTELSEELLETFLLEAETHLQTMHTALCALEKTPDDKSLLLVIRRSAHSLKGTSSLIGFRNIMQLAHRLEDLLELLSDKSVAFTPAAAQLLLRAIDALEDMCSGQVDEVALQQLYAEFTAALVVNELSVDAPDPASEEEPEVKQNLVEEDTRIASETEAALSSEAKVETEIWSFSALETTPECAMATAPEAPLDLAVETSTTTAAEPGIEPASLSEPESLLALDENAPATKLSFCSFSEETSQEEEVTEEIAGAMTASAPLSFLCEEAPVLSDKAARNTEAAPLASTELAAEVATPVATIIKETVVSPVVSKPIMPPVSLPETRTPQVARAALSPPAPTLSSQFLRVSIEPLDEVVKLVGEMIVTRTAFEQRLTEFARQLEELQLASTRLRRATATLDAQASAFDESRWPALPDAKSNSFSPAALASHAHGFAAPDFDRAPEFHLVARELAEASRDIQTVGREFAHLNTDFLSSLNRQGRIYNDLQDRLMRLRRVPLASVARRLQRVVRQVSAQENKLVELLLEGETTALDTTALQELVDPLLHLLRNAVGHGIEAPAVRVAQGKPATGTIRLRAFYEGSQVVLQLSDDGQGLDAEKIRCQAIQKGLLNAAEAEALSEAELWSLIFTPGLSTAEQLSEISGRGIGLDIVQSAVQKLKGTITLVSAPGAGVSFTLRLPLTLAVTRALMIKAHGQSFAIPLDIVTQIMRLDMNKVERVGNEPVIRVGGKVYPLLMLSRLLNLRQACDEIEARPPALLLNVEGREVVVIVDQLIGGREIVIKSLGSHLRKVHGVMGATLMGNGEVVLILSLAELVRGTTHSVVRRVPTLKTVSAPANEKQTANGAEAANHYAYLPSHADPRALTIMVVDDSPSVRRVNADLIQNLGWVVLQAKDGLEALEKLQASEATPDLIMLDIEMPRMDGYQFLAALRALPAFRHLPVVIVSSRSSEKHRQKAFDLGATDYLAKPYHEDEVAAVIRRLVPADDAGNL